MQELATTHSECTGFEAPVPLELLAGPTGLKGLQHLDLGGIPAVDDGALARFFSGHEPCLRRGQQQQQPTHGCCTAQTGDATARGVAAPGGGSVQLRSLVLWGTRVTAGCMARLSSGGSSAPNGPMVSSAHKSASTTSQAAVPMGRATCAAVGPTALACSLERLDVSWTPVAVLMAGLPGLQVSKPSCLFCCVRAAALPHPPVAPRDSPYLQHLTLTLTLPPPPVSPRDSPYFQP
jgi:hypothetical protein